MRPGSRLSDASAALDDYRAGVSERAPDLFSERAEAEQAIAQTADTHRGELLRELDLALERLPATREVLTVDDLRDELGDRYPTIDLRVLGSVMLRAARRGVLEGVGYRPSKRRHASPLRLWRSKVWRHDVA